MSVTPHRRPTNTRTHATSTKTTTSTARATATTIPTATLSASTRTSHHTESGIITSTPSESLTALHGIAYVLPDAPGVDVQITANQAVVTSVAASASIMASPAAAMQASRALSVIALSQCRFDYDGSIPFPSSVWPGFPVDRQYRGAYFRGAIVAALVTIVGLATVGMLLVHTVAVFLRQPTLRAAGKVRFPGLLTIPVGLSLDGLVSSTVATFLHGESRVLDTVLPVVVVLFLALVTAAAVYIAVCVAQSTCTFGDRREQAPESSRCSRRVDEVMRGSQGWVVDAAQPFAKDRHDSMGSIYKKYTKDRRWFYIADMWLAIFVSAAKGTMPTTVRGCYVAMGVVMALCGFAATLAAATRPYLSPAKNIVLVVSSTLTFIASALVLAAMVLDQNTLLNVGQLIALGAGYTSIANVVIALYAEFSARHVKKERHELMIPDADVSMGADTLMLELSAVNAPPAENEEVSLQPRVAVRPTTTTVTPHEEDKTNVLHIDDNDDDLVTLPTNASVDAERRQRQRGSTLIAPLQPRQVRRTAEGQALFEELDALLHHHQGTVNVTKSTKHPDATAYGLL